MIIFLSNWWLFRFLNLTIKLINDILFLGTPEYKLDKTSNELIL